jgi:KaiC/GvpD/RAD55 family RecA-like ATPase
VERKIISACLQHRGAYEELLSTGEEGQNFSDQGKIVFDEIMKFYDRDPDAKSVDREILLRNLKRRLSNEKQYDRFQALVEGLEEVSVANVVSDYIAMRKHDTAMELAQALLSGKDQEAADLMEKWHEFDEGLAINEAEEEVYEGLSMDDIMKSRDPANLIRIYPKVLNDLLDGGAMRGDHILISGRVEEGKSLMSINISMGCIMDGHKVLYIGNEDSPMRLRPRFVARLTEMTKNDQVQDPARAEALLKEKGADRFTFAAIPEGTFAQIEGLIRTYRPDVLVVDQVRNINVGIEEGSKQLEKVAKGMRKLIKKYNVLGISVTQSNNDEARVNKVICGMEDIDSSKVGLPAQADLILMMGSNERMRDQGLRMINIPKNKISGIHSHFTVQFNPLLSKVVGV